MRPIPFSFLDAPSEDSLSPDFAINLNRELIHSPTSTFLFRIRDTQPKNLTSQKNRSQNTRISLLSSNDIIIVDQSLIPCNNDIVLTVVNGEFVVQEFSLVRAECSQADNMNIEVRGVVASLIRVFR